MKRTPIFKTEADLCAAFIKWVKAEAGQYHHGVQTPRWTPYAETAGWDILLVAQDGTQIGVQAKLKFNLKVIDQSIPGTWDAWHDQGPDYRAVLIPERDSTADNICRALGLVLFAPQSFWGGVEFAPGLAMAEAWNGGWHYWSPRTRCALPDFVPDVVAGASGPVQLTKWKVQALRLIATLELRGHLTRQDFRTHGVDPRRWTGPSGWLKPAAVPGQFVRGEAMDFDRQHPEVYAQVLAEVRQQLQERGEVAA